MTTSACLGSPTWRPTKLITGAIPFSSLPASAALSAPRRRSSLRTAAVVSGVRRTT